VAKIYGLSLRHCISRLIFIFQIEGLALRLLLESGNFYFAIGGNKLVIFFLLLILPSLSYAENQTKADNQTKVENELKAPAGYIICRTNSNGIPFSDGDTNLYTARLKAIAQCSTDARTTDAECNDHVKCQGREPAKFSEK
jgi:hypothetical protein